MKLAALTLTLALASQACARKSTSPHDSLYFYHQGELEGAEFAANPKGWKQ